MSDVQLQPIVLSSGSQSLQTLSITLLKPDRLITTEELLTLELPSDLDRTQPVLLYGRAPLWFYAYLGERLRNFPWVAFFDIHLQGCVVVSSQSSTAPSVGDVISLTFNRTPAPAILIGGPPNSGKSVLANTLRVSLGARRPEWQLYLHRANWDGEGNYLYEMGDRQLAAQLKQYNKRPLHRHPEADRLLSKYFCDRAQDTYHIRQVVDLALVDVGGKPEAVKLPVVEQCTHCIIISRDPSQVQDWLDLCQGLIPIAVIHSVLEDKLEVLRTEPYLEIVAGRWERDQMRTAPNVLVETILQELS
ncbi:MAG: CRISPR-associated protein Csx3 [Kamptonema sp. SIO4C4]|nr:CRISPR-associated protein Csx3 [Kamptonema sp. SIO4C4]